jgi:hypothetical protein
MKAQHAALLTEVPSGQVARLEVGTAPETAASATKARRDAKAIAIGRPRLKDETSKELDVLRALLSRPPSFILATSV